MVFDCFDTISRDKSKRNSLIRDYYQLLILQGLFVSKFRSSLVLKGLCASKLAYDLGLGASEIEFISLEKLKTSEFIGEVESILSKISNLSILRVSERRYTILIELKIVDAVEIPITIELTKIKYDWKRGINYDVRIFEISEWALKVVGQVVNLTEIINSYPELKINKKLRF